VAAYAQFADYLTDVYAPAAPAADACGPERYRVNVRAMLGADLDPDLLAYARSHAPELAWHHADLATMQLPRRYRVVAMPGNVMIFCRPEHRRPIVHTVSRHLEPGGAVVAGFALEAGHQALTLDDYDALCADSGLTLVARYATWEGAPYEGGPYAVSVHRRPVVPADHDHLDF
jgi:hypothetical protein